MTKKTTGFYLTAASAVLSLICLFLYGNVLSTAPAVKPLLIANAVLCAAVPALISVKGSVPFSNLLPVAGAGLAMGALGTSIGPMASTVVFVFMGMSPMSSAQGYLIFAGLACLTWLLCIISSFTGIIKEI